MNSRMLKKAEDVIAWSEATPAYPTGAGGAIS